MVPERQYSTPHRSLMSSDAFEVLGGWIEIARPSNSGTLPGNGLTFSPTGESLCWQQGYDDRFKLEGVALVTSLSHVE